MATKAVVNLNGAKVLDNAIQVDLLVFYDNGATILEIATQKTFGSIPTGLTETTLTNQLKTIAAGMILDFAGVTVQPSEIVRGR